MSAWSLAVSAMEDTVMQIRVSSAKEDMVLWLTSLSMSDMKMRNKMGASTAPCGTELFTVATSDFTLFMLRTEAIKLYRNILRQLQHLPDKSQRKEIREWARADFETHRHHEDEEVIKVLIMQGKKQLEELEKTIRRAKS
ncbi:LYR motif-containing protein 2 isoform X2 [Cherax quadricarinatus]|uniref:LYR motif-containing protein 2 isoform X2 n=1 Tax=Cherax quadricarinatus TaxID=27406 RepID=UPI00387EA1B1